MNAPPPYQQQQQPPYPQQPGYPQPPYGQPPGPPPKKGMNGCLLAVLIVGGVFLVIGLVGAFLVWRFATSPDGQKIVSAVSSGAAIVSEATNAPGTKELHAIGCGTAMVIDAEKVQALADSFGDAGKTKVTGDERLVVTCAANSASSAPSCDQVAATYVTAVGRAVGHFQVTVDVSGESRPKCSGRYAPDGKKAK